jgi:hypothetical protein
MINRKCLHPIVEGQAAEIQCPVHCGFAIGFPDCAERLLHKALRVCAQSKWCWKLQVFLSWMEGYLDPIVFSRRSSNTGTHFNPIEGSRNKANCLSQNFHHLL